MTHAKIKLIFGYNAVVTSCKIKKSCTNVSAAVDRPQLNSCATIFDFRPTRSLTTVYFRNVYDSADSGCMLTYMYTVRSKKVSVKDFLAFS